MESIRSDAISGASGSHAGVTGRIDERDSARSCDYGSAALQNHDGVPVGGGLERDFDPTGLHIFDRGAEEARHFTRMWRHAEHSIRVLQL